MAEVQNIPNLVRAIQLHGEAFQQLEDSRAYLHFNDPVGGETKAALIELMKSMRFSANALLNRLDAVISEAEWEG
ncbi:MAG: hypothetical protein ACYS8L_07910 [Planctomycetota bacterium]|jgi:hypothetical protein